MKKHGLSGTRFYRIWNKVRMRTTCKKWSKYDRYGGRGIRNMWRDFEEFRVDMYPSYVEHVKQYGEDDTTLDRIDNDDHYCKENCRWATRLEQQYNRSFGRGPITFRGETLPLKAWAERVGIKKNSLWNRLYVYEWPLEKALTQKRAAH